MKYSVILNHFDNGILTYHVEAENPIDAEVKALVLCAADFDLNIEDLNEDSTTIAIFEGHLVNLRD